MFYTFHLALLKWQHKPIYIIPKILHLHSCPGAARQHQPSLNTLSHLLQVNSKSTALSVTVFSILFPSFCRKRTAFVFATQLRIKCPLHYWMIISVTAGQIWATSGVTRRSFSVFGSSKQRTAMVSNMKSFSACLVLNLKKTWASPLLKSWMEKYLDNKPTNQPTHQNKKPKPTAQSLSLPFWTRTRNAAYIPFYFAAFLHLH